MKKASLSGSLRGSVGKKDASAIRKEGRVPAVLYGGDQQLHLSVDAIQLGKLIYSPDVFQIQLDIDGTVYPCVIHDMQFHPVTDKVMHIDLLQLIDDKAVSVNIPVRTTGGAVGVMNGGRLAINHRRLSLRGLPGAIPEFVSVDVTSLDIGDSVRVRDLNLDGVSVGQADSDVVVAVKRTRAAMSAATAEDSEEAEGEEATEEAAE